MTSIMMIPTVDEDSEYYMSRTKTAMDCAGASGRRFSGRCHRLPVRDS